jgi:hypothetical protein
LSGLAVRYDVIMLFKILIVFFLHFIHTVKLDLVHCYEITQFRHSFPKQCCNFLLILSR